MISKVKSLIFKIIIVWLAYSVFFKKNISLENLLIICFSLLVIKVLWGFLKFEAENIRFSTAKLNTVDEMAGTEFEDYLYVYFKKEGYRVKKTPVSNDYGADLILEKDRIRTVVQVKRYSQVVGNKAVQEAIGAKGYYQADKSMVITNSRFSKNAINLAEANDVILWDRDDIKKIIK